MRNAADSWRRLRIPGLTTLAFVRIAAIVLATTFDSATALVRAQEAQARAAIAGVARDESGGVLPGVVVTATGSGGGQGQSTVTSGEGRYSIAVASGTYVVSAELPGFAPFSSVPISLQ
nr:carboxypeptidase-like regulatory domain-containing protein [Acidobacteriota bacterium]